MARKTQEQTDEEILRLRNPLVELFQALRKSQDFDVIAGDMQLEVFFRGAKVGGLNRRESHFYISKNFVASYGTPALLESHGFEWKVHSKSHQYWKLRGVSDHQSFRRVIEEMTRVAIEV